MDRTDAIKALDAARGAVIEAYGWQPGDPIPTGEAFLDALTEAGYVLVKAGPAPDGDPMPLFVLKGKDLCAPDAIGAYQNACVARGLLDQGGQVRLAAREFTGWQTRHPELTKLPDHPHVPAAAYRG